MDSTHSVNSRARFGLHADGGGAREAVLRRQPLQPDAASWSEQRGGSLALLPYEEVRTTPDPRTALLAFLESAYEAGARLAGWDTGGFESAWCPSPAQLPHVRES